MTDPASPAAVTEERIEFIRTQYNSLVATLAESNQTPGHWATYTADLLAAYDARGLELARVQDELSELRLLKRMLGEPIGDIAKLEARALAAEARLAQANEALPSRERLEQAMAECFVAGYGADRSRRVPYVMNLRAVGVAREKLDAILPLSPSPPPRFRQQEMRDE